MSIDTQARVAAGIPTGGQFSQSSKGEAGIALTSTRKVKDSDIARVVRMLADDVDEDQIREQVGSDLFDSMDTNVLAARVEVELDRRAEEIVAQQWDPERYAAEKEDAALRRTIEDSYASAQHWSRAKGVGERSRGVMDADDLAQEGRMALLERQANGQVINDPKAYAHTAIWGKANQAENLAVRQENRRALKEFNAACGQQTLTLGRALTSLEEDDIAKSIRDNWYDQQRKPSKDFRRFMGQMETSLNAFESPEQADAFLSHTEQGRPGETEDNYVTPGSFKDRSLDAVEGHGGDLRDARRMLWNALAEDSEAPMVVAGTLSQRKVTATRADMSAYAGGLDSALDVAEKGRNDLGTEALFAPWNTTDPTVRTAVIEQMRRYPDYAEAMWDSALKLANTRNADK